MKISSIKLKNFKRFTDLTVEDIPPDAKLVLLIGSNGSGKSSVFDAFRFAEQSRDGLYYNGPDIMSYYRKNNSNAPTINIYDDKKSNIFSYIEKNTSAEFQANQFYGRTSFRHIPRLTYTRNGKEKKPFNENTEYESLLFIDKDNLFESDIERISESIIREIFINKSTTHQIQANYIWPINSAFERIFGSGDATSLRIFEIIPPFENKVAQINFRKGASEIHYNLLSAGEKEVVNILFNLLVRKEEYKDTIYYIDELDLHLNTKLQYNLIKEITENWIPENCQLWTASHSLGFIDYANDSPFATTLDFDDFDFDKPQVIWPVHKKNYQVFEIAVGKDFLNKIFRDKKIIFSENTDTELYNNLLLPKTLFLTGNDKTDVFFKAKMSNTCGLIDRDYLTDEELVLIKKAYPDMKTLAYYSIENVLYHPDNLAEYFAALKRPFDKESYIAEITTEKNRERDIIAGSISKARDGYPFFKEPGKENEDKLKEFRQNWKAIIEMLRSDDFETFFKVFPAKDYGKSIAARQNLYKKELAKTKWFRQQIENVVGN